MDIEKRYYSLKQEQKRIKKELKQKDNQLINSKKKLNGYIQARILFKQASELAQRKLKVRIESLVTMAISAIYYYRKFNYKLNFKETKNNVIIRPEIIEDGKTYKDIEEELGGGIVDIITLSQKIIFLTLDKDNPRFLIVLDEPFKNLGVLSKLAGEMVRNISRRLNIQFIIFTHDENLKNCGDKIFNLTNKEGITKIN